MNISGKRWVLLLLPVSVMVLSLVYALVMLGQEPPTPSDVMVEGVSWQIDKPTELVEIQDAVVNFYEDENISLFFEAFIWDYGSGIVDFSLSLNCSVTRGFVERVDLFLREESNRTQVRLYYDAPTPFSERFSNLSVEEWAHGFSSIHSPGFKESLDISNPLKSYLKAVGVDEPSTVRFWNAFRWFLHASNQNYQMEVTLELTYRDQTIYKRIIVPISLTIVPDEDDNFETARIVNKGDYVAYVHIWDDPEDYYRIWLDNGETTKIELSPQDFIDLDLYLYDPDQNQTASSTDKQLGGVEQITYTADQSGWWYVRVVVVHAGFDVYSLSIGDTTL